MKFGMTFTEYLHGHEEDQFSHVEYKRLKKVLKSCRLKDSNNDEDDDADGCLEIENQNSLSELSEPWQCESCPVCDEVFFSELMKEASDVAGCFRSRVRRLLHLHNSAGMQKYLMSILKCFKTDQQAMVQECQMLIEYVLMNAIALRKILKKYDKVHSSETGSKFKSKMRAERIEILQSTWLIELGSFYLNFSESKGENMRGNQIFNTFSCNLSNDRILRISLPGCVKLEYDFTCAICLESVFCPYALSCGHIFCKSCVCSAASVMNFQGLKAASPESRCPICRESGVYHNAVRLIELDMLLKKRFKEYWKERLIAERAETAKQSKIYWETQTKYMIGY